MTTINECVNQILRVNMQLKEGEVVTIIYDKQTENLANIFEKESNNLGSQHVARVDVDRYRDQVTAGKALSILSFLPDVKKHLRQSDISLFLATQRSGETEFRKGIIYAPQEFSQLGHGHIPTASEDMLLRVFSHDIRPVLALTDKIYEIVKDAHSAKITTPAGTNLNVCFNPKYRWVNCNGIIERGMGSNVLPAEVYTAPGTSNGYVVVDGLLGCHFAEEYGPLKVPVIFEVNDGLAHNISCKDKCLEEKFKKFLRDGGEYANRLAEVAVATNYHLERLRGDISEDEKKMGVHIALGSPYPKITGADWEAKTHLDCIFLKPTITFMYQDRPEITIVNDGEIILQ